MDTELSLREYRERQMLKIIRQQLAEQHRRAVQDCLERWFWGEMGQTANPTPSRPAPLI